MVQLFPREITRKLQHPSQSVLEEDLLSQCQWNAMRKNDMMKVKGV